MPSGTPGFTVEPAYDKLGWHISDTHGLTFDDCRVPEANLLGHRGDGFRQFLAVLDDGRIAIAALAVGLAQACLDHSLRYANERHTFGAPIGSRQAVAFSLSRPRRLGGGGPAADLQGRLAQGRRAALGRS